MNSKNCLLLSHVWIRPEQEYKKDIIDFSIRHFIKNNSDLYIILSGHGQRPHTKTIDLCDYVHWGELDNREITKGHPRSVSVGLHHAKEIGFTKILKQRADCIIADHDVHDLYDSMLGGKKLLVTADHSVIGDLLMYGDIEVILDGWNINYWHARLDGSENFNNILTRHQDLKYTHIELMKWVFLDPFWEEIQDNNMEELILNNDFDFKKYLWGQQVSRRAQFKK